MIVNIHSIAQWNRISSSDTTNSYTSVWFLNKDTGFVCGNAIWSAPDYSIILRTMDGGNTWDTTFFNSGPFLMSIQFINDSTGYFSGQDGYTYKTSDMGNAWIPGGSCFLGGDLSSLFFLKIDTGFMHLFGGALVRVNTMPLSTPCVYIGNFGYNYFPGTGGLRFLNGNDGYVAGGLGKFARTSDGGNTWQPYNGDSTIEVLCAWMSDTSHGVIGGTDGKVSVTNNGGNTWSPTDTISQYSILDMSFVNAMKGYAVGGTGIWWWTVPNNERKGLIWKTLDGGYTWAVDDSSFSDNIVSIFIVNDSLAYAAGNLGVILKNSNLFYDGINENISSEQNIFLSPNPATDKLRIKNSELRIKNIEIYNVFGERVYKSESPKSEINISNLPSGIYVVRVNADKTQMTGKFVKE